MRNLINKTRYGGILSIISQTIIIFTIIIMTGCDKSDNSNERTAILTIEPQTVLNGTVPESDQLVECMVAKEEGTDVTYYLYLSRIEGFEYDKGFEYRMKVLISSIKNPPMDGHTESFKLIELLSKVKVNE